MSAGARQGDICVAWRRGRRTFWKLPEKRSTSSGPSATYWMIFSGVMLSMNGFIRESIVWANASLAWSNIGVRHRVAHSPRREAWPCPVDSAYYRSRRGGQPKQRRVGHVPLVSASKCCRKTFMLAGINSVKYCLVGVWPGLVQQWLVQGRVNREAGICGNLHSLCGAGDSLVDSRDQAAQHVRMDSANESIPFGWGLDRSDAELVMVIRDVMETPAPRARLTRWLARNTARAHQLINKWRREGKGTALIDPTTPRCGAKSTTFSPAMQEALA